MPVDAPVEAWARLNVATEHAAASRLQHLTAIEALDRKTQSRFVIYATPFVHATITLVERQRAVNA
jgi:hypothetical protein